MRGRAPPSRQKNGGSCITESSAPARAANAASAVGASAWCRCPARRTARSASARTTERPPCSPSGGDSRRRRSISSRKDMDMNQAHENAHAHAAHDDFDDVHELVLRVADVATVLSHTLVKQAELVLHLAAP